MLYQSHVYIKGDVVGVGFRAWTKIQAKIIGVKGWVRNNFERPEIFGPEGGVEAVFQTEESDKLQKIIALVKKGSPVSRVDDVEVTVQEAREVFEEFLIVK